MLDLLPTSPQPTSRVVHVGRQPIYDTGLEVFGHELLFRPSAQATVAGSLTDPAAADQATTSVVLNTFTAFGLPELVGGRPAFVNLTRSFVVGEMPLPFTPGSAVLELLEDVEVDDTLLAEVERLASAGFDLALDDFLWTQPGRERLLPHMRYVKVDIRLLDHDGLAETVRRLKPFGVRLVAERVEDAADLERCRALGFDLFQGYHLLRPETLSAVALNPDHLACLEVLRRLAEPSAGLEEIELVVRRDAALTYRVLAAANSAAAGARRRLPSVRDALVLLGTERLRAWVLLLVASDAGGATEEQLVSAVVRARTCELLAPARRLAPEVAFTAGLLSRLDVVLGVRLETLLERLSLSEELTACLLAGTGPLAGLLREVVRYETTPDDVAADLPEAYLAALVWATRTTADLRP